MMIKLLFNSCLFLVFVGALCLSSQQVYAQKYSNEFLAIGVGARAHAMGHSVASSVNDVSATYWNPAALSTIDHDGLQLGAMHSEWFAGIGRYDYLAMSVPMGEDDRKRRLGVSLIRFGIDNIPNTLSLYEDDGSVNYDNISSFSAADYAIMGSYSQAIVKSKNPLYVGGNLKIVRRIIGNFADSWGFGIDASALYQPGNWSIAFVAKDISTTFNAWTVDFTEEDKAVLLATGNELPDINSVETTLPSFHLNISRKWAFNKVSVLPEISLAATTDGQRNTLISSAPVSIDPGMGLELGYDDFVFFRAGVNQFQEESNLDQDNYWTARPALGAGLKLNNFVVDYAFSNLGDDSNRYSHIVSLVININKKS